nr:arginase family protein [Rhodococcus opacus]
MLPEVVTAQRASQSQPPDRSNESHHQFSVEPGASRPCAFPVVPATEKAHGCGAPGAPWDCSGSARGEQAAPHAFREAGLSAMVGRDVGDAATVIDRTDRDEATGVIALSETVRAAHALADDLAVAMADLPGRRPLVVGGDCSILLGIFPALRRHLGSAGLWFVDGHPNYLDGRSSDTGETADMELAVR